MATTLDHITGALQNIGKMGAAQATPNAEDIVLCLRRRNLMVDLWNASKRYSRFERMQTFPITTSAQSYSIGKSTNTPTPDLIVAAGNRPVRIDHANWYLSSGAAPNLSYPIEVINVENYWDLPLPNFSGVWPYGLYYQPTDPNGTIWPWPYPTDIADSLQLFWWDQIEPVTMDAISTELALPSGYDKAMELSLTEEICLPFKVPIPAGLTKAASDARAAIQRNNVHPKAINTTGMVTSDGYPWRPYAVR